MFYQWKLSITALIACILQWPWIACQSSVLSETVVVFSKHTCTVPASVWTGDWCEVLFIYIIGSLKRNKYSLSHNIKKLTRKERISGDIATIIVCNQMNGIGAQCIWLMLLWLYILYLWSNVQQNHSWDPAEYNVGKATHLGKSNE